MTSKWKRAIIIMMFLAVCFQIHTLPAYATTGSGSIKITLEPLEETQSKRENITFKLYRVGDVMDGVPQIYSKYHIFSYPQMAEDTELASQSILKHLDALPIVTGMTDKNGELIFSNVDDGVYLLVAQHPNEYGDVTPTLLHLPYHEVVDDQVSHLLYQITVNPKAVYINNNKPNQNTDKDPDKDPNKDPDKNPNNDSNNDPNKNPNKDQNIDSNKVPSKNPEENSNKDSDKTNENVSTNDTSKRMMYVMMMAVAAGGIYVFYKRKKAMSNE